MGIHSMFLVAHGLCSSVLLCALDQVRNERLNCPITRVVVTNKDPIYGVTQLKLFVLQWRRIEERQSCSK